MPGAVTLPEPVLATVRLKLVAVTAAKWAVAVALADSVRLQLGAVPVQAPLQLTKRWPLAGVAVRSTFVPGTTLSEQSVPQLMPAPAERMLPLPLTVVLSRTGVTTWPCLKLAVTCVVPFKMTEHAASVPVQPPLHELNT
jgi:hypothetical protein